MKYFILVLFVSLSVYGNGLYHSFSVEHIDLDLSDTVSFSGALTLSNPGRPALPLVIKTFLIPHNADATQLTVSLQHVEEDSIAGNHYVSPAPLDILPSGDTLYIPQHYHEGVDTSVYYSNSAYPPSPVELKSVGKTGIYQLVEVALYPYRFIPAEGRIIQHNAGIIHLQWVEHDSPPELAPISQGAIQRMTEVAASVAINYGEFDYPLPAELLDAPETYVIITTETIVAASTELENFISSKQQEGFRVIVATDSDWGGGMGVTAAKNIRTWLREHYATENITNALLIGNPHPEHGDIPMRGLYPSYGSIYLTPTDYFYSDLSCAVHWENYDPDAHHEYYFGSYEHKTNVELIGGPDKYSEIVVGRIPVFSYGENGRNDVQRLDAILQRTIEYNTCNNRQWRNNAFSVMPDVFRRGRFDWHLMPYEPTYVVGEKLKEVIYNPESFGTYSLYDEPFVGGDDWPASHEKIMDVWTNGSYGVVNWLQHGNRDSAYCIRYHDIGFYILDINSSQQLSPEFPSIVFMGSCLNGSLDFDQQPHTNLQYELLYNGGIATIAASEVATGNIETDKFDSGCFQMPSVSFNFQRNLVVDSLSVSGSLDFVRRNHHVTIGPDWQNFVTFNVYGDPSTRLLRKDLAQPHTIHVSSESNVTPPYSFWEPENIYTAGDRVAFGSDLWEAKWWTQGEYPVQTPWGPWNYLGSYVNGGDIIFNGNILFEESVSVQSGTNAVFEIEPHEGSVLVSLVVDGIDYGNLHNFTFYNVQSQHHIEIFFDYDLSWVECQVLDWDPNRQYHAGDQVVYDSDIWIAKWWSLGEEPADIAYGPWEKQ